MSWCIHPIPPVPFDRRHPTAGVVCGSGGKEQTPKHLPVGGPTPTGFPGTSLLWRLGAIGFGCFWGDFGNSYPVIPEQSLVLATERPQLPSAVEQDCVAVVTKFGIQWLGILRG